MGQDVTGTTVHASNRRGQVNCGDTTPGNSRENTDFHPEKWALVTCPACFGTKAPTDAEMAAKYERQAAVAAAELAAKVATRSGRRS